MVIGLESCFAYHPVLAHKTYADVHKACAGDCSLVLAPGISCPFGIPAFVAGLVLLSAPHAEGPRAILYGEW